MDVLVFVQSIPILGPYLPYIMAAFGICALIATMLPPPARAGSAYGVIYALINLAAQNYGHAKNTGAPNAPPAAGAPGKAAAVLLAAALGAAALLGACTAQQLAATQQAAPAVGTLLQLAALNNATVSGLVMKGQPFCKKADGTIIAVGAVTGNPIVGALAGTVPYGALALSVINATDEGVGKLCAMVEAVPAPPPSDVPTASVPVAIVPAAAAAAALKPAA